VAESEPAAVATASSGVEYSVQAGDTLRAIARATGDTWRSLYATNEGVIGSDPNLIYVGQVLTVQGAPAVSGESYTVQHGDTLIAIANANGTDWESLYDANEDVVGGNPNLILPGQTLTIV
jgi:nucleoid-associated protein YgaU